MVNIESLIDIRNSRLSIRIASHLLFWLVSMISAYVLIRYSFDLYRNTPLVFLTPLRNIIGLVLVFYPLMYFVIPRYLNKENWILLFLSLFALIAIYVLLEAVGEKLIFYFCATCLERAKEIHPTYVTVIQKSILTNILFKASNIQLYLQLFSGIIIPVAIKSSLGYYQYYTKSLKLEKEKIDLELNFLKAQVNPHFLFNTLNNIYGLLIHKKTTESAASLEKLSNFLRYSLESANKSNIYLSDEISLIENYLALEKLRLNYTEIDFKQKIQGKDVIIPPLLFLPLLENAFKYNVDQLESVISIDLVVDEKSLSFEVRNSFDEKSQLKSSSGLGLKNLEKRLELHFQNNYIFDVNTYESIFVARLKLLF